MEDLDIRQLWHAYDIKLEKTLQLNYKIIKEMQAQKAEDSLSSFRRNQVFGVVAGIIWILFLAFLIFHTSNIYFIVSIGLIALFNVFAVAAYIRHLAMLENMNVTESITQAQRTLSAIQASLNNVGRILVLQTPFYATFWYNQQLIAHGDSTFWLINIVVVAFLVIVAIYLYNKLTYKNIHIRWVSHFIEGFGGKQLIKAMEFLNEIEDYKKE